MRPRSGLYRGSVYRGLVLGSLLLAAGRLQAQQNPTELRANPGNQVRPATLERNAPIENLLKRAEDALKREDWKAAIDALQRVLEDNTGGVLQAGEARITGFGKFPLTYYASARSRATALLATMPPAGRQAYRLLNDGRAQALLSEALTEHDENKLRLVVERFLTTSVGDDAAVDLAAWRIDAGRPGEALELLNRMQMYCEDTDVSPARVALLRAACAVQMGQPQRAADVLAAAKSDEGTTDALRIVGELAKSSEARDVALASTTPEDSWPMAGGTTLRQSRMPAAAPELQPDLPWRYAMPSDYPDWWEQHCSEEQPQERDLPASEAIVSDGRIFVRSLDQLVALDLDSLEELWRADSALEALTEKRMRLQVAMHIDQGEDPYNDSERLLYDYVGNAISAAFNLVVSIERSGGDEYLVVSGARVGRRRPEISIATGTRLVARNAETGKIAWARGRNADTADPLGAVNFLSAPFPIGDELWVVYAKANDLYLAALAPADGALRRKLLLVSIDELQLGGVMHLAIYPASDGGMVYLSTNVGMVMAVDASEFTTRWATHYPREVLRRNELAPQQWSSCAPVVAGTVLVVAPPDADQLVAFDRATGEVRWSRPRGRGQYYILAADERRVWLAGRTLECVSAEDGASLWATPEFSIIAATGKAALCGGMILTPTRTDLARNDADTGQSLDPLPLPSDQLPLGNLLCMDGALVSVDPNEVRKFPDLTSAYPRALARHEADPSDAKAAMRLAWMELLRKAPDKAYAALAGVRGGASRTARLATELARLRMDALLGMAQTAGTTPDQALRYLDEAVHLDLSDRDRLRSTMALAAKLREAGRPGDAYKSLWELGLSTAGDGYITIEPKLRNKARRVIAEVLARFEGDLSARQLHEIAERSRQELLASQEKLANPEAHAAAVQKLAQLAELNDAGGAGQAALVALAGDARAAGQLERSEQYLRNAIGRDRVAAVTGEARRDLAAQYLMPQQQLYSEAASLVGKLAANQGSVTFAAADGKGEVSGAQEADRLRTALSASGAAAARTEFRPARFQLRETPPIDIKREDSHVLEYEGDADEAAHRYIYLSEDRTVAALDDVNGGMIWSAGLRLLDDQVADLNDSSARGNHDDAIGSLWCDGQTGVVVAPEGLFAVGLLSGRRLWGVGYEEPETADLPEMRDRLAAVGHGRLYFAPRRGVLACASLVDAGDLLWERVLYNEKIDKIFVADDYCITLDGPRRKATVYAAESGRRYSEIKFTHPDEDAPLELAYVRGQIVGPQSSRSIACYSARTGELNWSKELPADLGWIFKPGDDLVGIVCAGGHVMLIDVLGGDVVMETAVPQAEDGFAEGRIHGDALLLLAVNDSQPFGDDPVLISLDRKTAAVRWTREGFGASGLNRFAYAKLLDVADGVVPMFRRAAVDSEIEFRQQLGEIAVEVYDKSTGEPIGPSVRTKHSTSTHEGLTGEFGLWPGRFVVGARNSLLILPIEAAPPAAAVAPVAREGAGS